MKIITTLDLKFLLILFAVWMIPNSSSNLMAKPISVDQAKQNAINYLISTKKNSVQELTLSYTMHSRKSLEGVFSPVLYVFNVGNNAGFVITSGDDVAIPVLGYSEHGYFDSNNIPCNVKAWLEGYSEDIEGYRNEIETNKIFESSKTRIDIAPMLKSTWDQDAPYNDQCVFDGIRCVTGCEATALAQIMYYWATQGKDGETYKCGSRAIPAYITRTEHYSVPRLDAISSFDWNNMTDGQPSTTVSKKAVAQLLRYCGQAMQIDYTDYNSNAYFNDIESGMKKYFGYNSAISYIWDSDDSMTLTEWIDLVYNQLNEGKPVIMCGGMSHVFICDGYQSSTGKFHFNWGWSGYYDGWFSMNAIEPYEGYELNSQKLAFINIQPLESSSYAELSSDGKTLTFYNDNNKLERTGTLYELNNQYLPEWASQTNITKVVFDISFANARPTSTYSWFRGMSNLTSIINMKYMNMSNVTNSDYMFAYCSSLKSISLPQGVTSIGRSAFWGCSGLTSVDIPNSVTSIGDYAFYGCTGLTSIDIPNSVITIGSSAFDGCTGLTSVDIPNSVITIGSYAFYDCTGLTSVTCKAKTPPTMGNSYVFSNYTTPTLYVPMASIEAYQTTDYWSRFTHIVGVDFPNESTPGDVDGDGIVNITDVTTLIDYLLSGGTVNESGADVDGDGIINITDITELIDKLLNGN